MKAREPDRARAEATASVLDGFTRLDRLVSADGYRGYEFDDFLASPLLRALSFDKLLLKRVFIQVGERLPLNVRPLLGIPKLPSTKANGFFARGYLHAFEASGERAWLEKATALLDWLAKHASAGYAGPAWGNAFEFASRAGVIPKGQPTVVWTSHIGEAFWIAHSITRERRYRDAVVGIGDFVLNDLPRHEDEAGVCLGYTPTLVPLLHNSNLLGAVALLRAWALDEDAPKLELAERAFAWSLAHMNADGSWFYGVGDQWAWLDSHHTAYVIDCLIEGRRLAGERLVPGHAVRSTVDFWERHFFEPDGAPRYYADRRFPLDSQAAAQAIETFVGLAGIEARYVDRAHETFRWAEANLRRRDGFYVYRRGRFFTNRLASIHWAQATMLAALGALYRASAAGTEEGSMPERPQLSVERP